MCDQGDPQVTNVSTWWTCMEYVCVIMTNGMMSINEYIMNKYRCLHYDWLK